MQAFYEKNSSSPEVEVRFGNFSEGTKASKPRFTPGVNRDQFMRILDFLKKNVTFYKHTVHYQKIETFDTVRKITEQGVITFNKKIKKENFDVADWGFRLASSSEEDVPPVEGVPSLVRSRTRYTFVNEKNKTKYDLDITTQEGKPVLYTVELERLDGCEYKNIKKDIDLTLRIIQETENIISKSVTQNVIQYHNEITKGRKFSGIQPKTLSIDKLQKDENYAITKKLDGRRYLILQYNGDMYTVSSKMDIHWIPYKCDEKVFGRTILDAEFYKGHYHVFDVVNSEENLVNRVEYIKKLLPCISGKGHTRNITLKEYKFTNNVKDMYNVFKKDSMSIDTDKYDGLILVRQDAPYKKSDPLKWKPVYMNTVDFQIEKLEGNVFSLLVNTTKGLQEFTQSQANKENYNLYDTGDIVEFSYDGKSWNPLKIRNDKDKPNFITIAEDNLHSVMCPFNPEEAFNDKVALFNMRRFHNYVKRVYINKYRGRSVLDLASGKGGDLGKYVDSGFTTIHGYDINSASVKEALSRSMKITKKSGPNVIINIKTQDLNKKQVEPYNGLKFDLVVSNFAFHYFYNNLDTYIKSVKNNIQRGGRLMLTFFDGDLIKNMKTPNYEIKKIGTDKVSVWMKDSVLDKPETEYIVNIKSIVDMFKKNDLELIDKQYFDKIYKNWGNIDKKNKLTDEEKSLSFMNVILVFESK